MFGKSMILVDAGNVHSQKKGELIDREAQFILDIMNQQDYDVSSFGPKDYLLAEDVRNDIVKKANFDWVGSNYPDTSSVAGVKDFYVQKVDGVKVGFLSYIDPLNRTNNLSADQLKDNLEASVAKLRPKCDVLVLIAHTSPRGPEEYVKRVPDVDVVILGGVTSPWTKHRTEGKTVIGNSGDRGRHIARFELLLNREKEIVNTKYEVVKLDNKIPRDEATKVQMEEFSVNQEKVKMANLEKMRQEKLAELNIDPGTMPGENSNLKYMGEKECRTCHKEHNTAFRRTAHSRAFSDLIRGKQSHLDDKVKRAVTGYLEKTGYIDRRETAHLYNVQCEACHGRASAHVISEGKELETLLDPKLSCDGCHSDEPDFDLTTALTQVHDLNANPPVVPKASRNPAISNRAQPKSAVSGKSALSKKKAAASKKLNPGGK
jgi:hypothetical protein